MTLSKGKVTIDTVVPDRAEHNNLSDIVYLVSFVYYIITSLAWL